MGARVPRASPLPLYESGAINAIGLVSVVRPASEPEVRDRGFSAASHRDDVIELEELALTAAPALVVDVRTLVSIPTTDCATNRGRDVPGVLGCDALPK